MSLEQISPGFYPKRAPTAKFRSDLALPLRATGGRFVLAKGDDLSSQIIATAIGDSSNENAFRARESLATIFDPNDPMVRSKVLSVVKARFLEFESQHRFKLLPDTVQWFSRGSKLMLSLRYVDLESQVTIQASFSPF